MLKIEELAHIIADLDETEQDKLWGYVTDLNFHKSLFNLSSKYRERLTKQEKIERSAEEIISDLRRIREEIALNDYSIQKDCI
ncbi:MAG: hypothetical protein QG641_1440 [Candidatus Poribacteria bacterium]|nr:hypothetical protein [Candidatus Poribacteria bacterium]